MCTRTNTIILVAGLMLGAINACDCEPGTPTCGNGGSCDAGAFVDASVDGAAIDAMNMDSGPGEAGPFDARHDAGNRDSAGHDGVGTDAAGHDAAGTDATGHDAAGTDAATTDAAGTDAAGHDVVHVDGGGFDTAPPEPQLCGPHAWKKAVPASGTAMMAYGPRAYLFAADGRSWASVENETAITQPIPLPGGVAAMRSVFAEIAHSQRPFVFFSDGAQRHGAFFDGTAFVGRVAMGQASAAHADAAERIHALTPDGLTEFVAGELPIVRGAMPHSGPDWGVGPDGTVYQLYETTRPSTIHPGDTANDLRLTHLPHGSLTWEGDALVASNEGYGFGNARMGIAPDGSFHVFYNLSMYGYYFRSRDGESWEESNYTAFSSVATLVDYAATAWDSDPTEVKGGIRLIAAQSYDRVSITLQYSGGSMSVPGQYFVRRCEPFEGYNQTWPAERLAYSGLAFDDGAVAVNQHGLVSILTPYGVRQDMATPAATPTLPTIGQGCGGNCTAALPACSAVGDVQGPLGHGVDVETYGSYEPGPLLPIDDRSFVFVEGSDMWMTAANDLAVTEAVPDALVGGENFFARRSAAGLSALIADQNGEVALWPFDGTNLGTRQVLPCNSALDCDARLAGDGHAWVYTGGNFYEQEVASFANRGGGPATPSYWDVDSQNTVIVLASGTLATEVLVTWTLASGAGGWTKAGVLSDDEVAAADAAIEGGFGFGSSGLGTIAADGSIHLFSDAHCIGTGDRNKVQVHLRSHDGESWEIETLPDIDTLTGGLLTRRNVAFWAADYDRVRHVVMSSEAPVFDGYTWSYPDRRFDVVARCQDGGNPPSFVRLGSVPLPGWTTRGFAGFSAWGTATLLTSAGLTQIR